MPTAPDRAELVAMLEEMLNSDVRHRRKLGHTEITDLIAALQPPEPVVGEYPVGWLPDYGITTPTPPAPDAAAEARKLAAWVRSMTNNGEFGLSLNSEGVRRVISLAEEDGNLRERLTNSLDREIRGDLHRDRLVAELERANELLEDAVKMLARKAEDARGWAWHHPDIELKRLALDLRTKIDALAPARADAAEGRK